MTHLTKKLFAGVAIGALMLSITPSGALAIEWPDAPEPSGGAVFA